MTIQTNIKTNKLTKRACASTERTKFLKSKQTCAIQIQELYRQYNNNNNNNNVYFLQTDILGTYYITDHVFLYLASSTVGAESLCRSESLCRNTCKSYFRHLELR